MTPRSLWPVLLLLSCTSVSAESLRGTVKGEALPDGPPVVLGLDEIASVPLPAGSKFSKAVEVEITIPREVFPYRSNLAVFIYQNFQTGKGTSGSTGDRVGIEVLPPAGKFYLEAPLVPKAGLKAAIDTAVLKLAKFDGAFPLAITILPIDKELPPGYEKFQFSVKTRVVNANLGALVLVTPTLADTDRARLKITANGVPQPAQGPLLLEPGPYTLEIALPGGAAVTLTAVVTQAKTTEVPVDLTQEEPSVEIEAPEGTQVVIDGKRLVWKALTGYPVERGMHTVQFVVGNTVVSDSFTIDQGGRHRLSLKMSVTLERE
ncbi:MAG TPA: hypothetical protein VMB23_10915 [Spirochaetia bacterium]|nr:hypothetical protein [Spirochaetia bacterium]